MVIDAAVSEKQKQKFNEKKINKLMSQVQTWHAQNYCDLYYAIYENKRYTSSSITRWNLHSIPIYPLILVSPPQYYIINILIISYPYVTVRM